MLSALKTVLHAFLPPLPEFDKFRFGEIGDVYVPRSRRAYENRGFAFVRFLHKEDMEAALKMDGTDLRGRRITVAPAQFGKNGMISWAVCFAVFVNAVWPMSAV